MSQPSVSSRSIQKVESYFKRETLNSEGNTIIATVAEIAEKSGLALATGHKAIKELEKKDVIKVIRPKSKREAIQYIYEGREEKTKEELEALVKQYEEEIKQLKERLVTYEKGFNDVKVVTVDENLELIVKQKK